MTAVAETYCCLDCPAGNVIEGRIVRVERRLKHLGTNGHLKGKVVHVERLKGWDYYCVDHYEARKARRAV